LSKGCDPLPPLPPLERQEYQFGELDRGLNLADRASGEHNAFGT
jgi:hypothetical protein